MNPQPESTTNRASATYTSIADLTDAIRAAAVLGMRDITVTTVHTPGADNGHGYVPSTTKYHLDAGMLHLTGTVDRTAGLAHVARARQELATARASR